MIFHQKILPKPLRSLALVALFRYALPAVAAPDPRGVRDALANAEEQHRQAYVTSKFADAITAARGGLALAERAGTLPDQIQFVRHLAYDNWLMGDNDSALDYSQRLLDYAERLKDNRIRSQGNRYLSQIYETMQDNARALSHAKLALQFAQLAGDEEVRIYALTAVGESEACAHHYDAALRAFEECHTYWQKHSRPWNAINSLTNLADVAEARGDLPAALKSYEEIVPARIASKDPSGQVRAVAAMANILRRLGRNDEALARLTATRSLAEMTGGHRILVEYYESLAQAQEAAHDFPAALASARLAATEREALTSERARLRATELEARLELLQKQEAIAQLRTTVAVNEAHLRAAVANLAQARSFRIAVIDGTVAIIVVSLATWIALRYRARTKRLQAAVSKAVQASSPKNDFPPEVTGPCAD